MRVPFQSAGRHATTRLGSHSQRRLAHLITPGRVESGVESRLIFARPKTLFGPFQRYQPFSSQPMATLDSATQALAALSITPSGTVEHASASSPAEWKEALQTASGAPKEFELLKVLVFKPKTAKGATPVPVVVVARDTTETSSSSLAKHLNLKDLRLASEDLLSEFFSLDKDSLSPLILTAETFPRVTTVIDISLATAPVPLAVRALSSHKTLFLSGADISAYLRTLEIAETKLHEVDFVALKGDAAVGTAAQPKQPTDRKEKKPEKEDAKIEGAVQIAIGVKKEVDFAAWYTNVLIKADMLDYYSVSGCYILKPWSYSIWETIQEWFNSKIKEMGVENSYFPMFVSQKVLEREKDHIEGFSPGAANQILRKPIAIRPTSETAMYPYYAKWIKSHRDLPLKLNQWNSVVRWEFKNPQPFLQGHTAHLTKAEADKEVLEILDLYRRVFEELLAVPVIPGVKSEKEKFAGGLYTTTVEGFIPTSGRGIQGATSHCLGPKLLETRNDPNDPTGQGKTYVWQNSWGLSTRTIGVMVMVHGDNQGLVLPPRVASVQAIVVPCGITAKTTEEQRLAIAAKCEELVTTLKKVGVRARADLRDGYTPGYKFNDWEQKGVPLRLEIGPQDLAKSQTLGAGIEIAVPALLETIQNEMFTRAKDLYWSRIKPVTEWEKVVPTLDDKCVVVLPWCEVESCEDDIKERSGRAAEPQDERAPSAGAKSLAIPFDQGHWDPIIPGKTKCPACGRDSKRWTLFGRSY
ncbi:prolyl-tRNA synthetase [Lactarius hengduanensis]|nr:prolyl-tRNA synthetase [Lactarius hengduanensis]